MSSNIDKYKRDLDALIGRGEMLQNAIQFECCPDKFRKAVKDAQLDPKEVVSKLPSFTETYQSWYSEALVLIRQILPDRLDDFTRHYEKPKSRKEISFENYRIEDYLQGLRVTRRFDKETVVGPDAAIPQFRQQLSIVKALKRRFESSLFDIRQILQADLFDSELEAAAELLKNGFVRAAGAVAGVVLEKHLGQVCGNRGIKVQKRDPTISDLNDVLKKADVLDLPAWRFIQHLGDIRNLCDHDKKIEPTKEQVAELVQGVAKVIKTVF
jgi:hypothetical protein